VAKNGGVVQVNYYSAFIFPGLPRRVECAGA
jgi:hypothetical protein